VTHAPLAATAAVADAVRDAAARRAPQRIVGRGTWLDAGRPVADAEPLRLDALAGIVDYTPGDLTLTALAGTSLAELARVTAAERQWLALDAFGSTEGTLGATVSTASAGPLAHAFGTPRDNVLGLEFVTGEGEVVRGGGRVVKNVAGFDLVRLLTGAWGTLGAITEVSVRLRSEPEVDATVAIAVPPVAGLDAWLARVRSAPLAAWALELVNGALAERIGLERRMLLLARLGGNAALVRAQRATLATLGDTADVDGEVWARLRACEPSGSHVTRFSDRPSRMATHLAPWLEKNEAMPDDVLAHATVSRGVVRVIIPVECGGYWARDEPEPESSGHAVFERVPQHNRELWDDMPRLANDPLSLGVKRAFDPLGILNPGIL
jgi:glycolate oxidase FAD binding subunit